MKELREHNENMLRNILPSHVARHFLEKDRDNEVSPGLFGAVKIRGSGRGELTALIPSSQRTPLSSCEHTTVEATLAT